MANKTHLNESFLREIDELLSEKGQLIFEGPPGSGKTFVAEHFAHWFTGQSLDGGSSDHVEIVQFHQSYGYEDFVQGIRPETSATGQLTYNVRDGIFLDMCRRAKDRPGENFVLLIDEINRGNISRIFGELLLLLEYRNKRARLPYATGSDPYISIPKNLFIIGTMNSADRSLAQVDYALRRRFYFVRFMPIENGEATVLARWLQAQHLDDPGQQRVLAQFVALNRKVSEHLSPDFQIGHSYFMNANVGDPKGFDRVWTRAIQPLLEEYFHHHRERESILAEIRALVYTATPDATNDEPSDDLTNGVMAG
ncbi:MAG: AAA family ATPase [Chloroflexota bacterium]|nr:AAA family ATPase [Chloroflexota bacterium]